MPKYLIRASYTSDGLDGLMKEGGSSRRAAVEQLVSSLGGTLESMYWAFGADDVVAILDMPDNVSAAAASLTVAATGTVATDTVVLLTADDIDAATKQSGDFRPAGG